MELTNNKLITETHWSGADSWSQSYMYEAKGYRQKSWPASLWGKGRLLRSFLLDETRAV